MIREVTYYRVVCDASDCKASPQDDSDYTAWASPDGALDDMHDCEDWYTDGSQHLCDEHAPICAKPDCQVKLSDAEFGAFCEDHPPSKVSSGSAT